jgi:ubiquinone/menaquinone biosynthesis C-methylase UbiE
LFLKKYLTGPDTFIRHLCLADLASDFSAKTILDVGGEGYLSEFIKARVVSVNVKMADVCYSGVKLPFKDNAFDIVTSCDTLEHIPKNDRYIFINEHIRVCRKGVVICAPFGTPAHIEAEKKIVIGVNLPEQVKTYLEEHIRYGLPLFEELSAIKMKFHGDLFFQGDFRKVDNKTHSRIVSYFYLINIAVRNCMIKLFWRRKKHLNLEHSPFTNRFYLIIRKEN